MTEIIAIPSFGNGGLNELYNPRFGRCESFTFVTVENGSITKVKGVLNNASNAMGGAGIKAAQIVGNHGANVAIVGFLGPNAAQALSTLDLDLFQAPNQEMTVKRLIDLYLSGNLNKLTGANVGSHFGMERGRGGRPTSSMGGQGGRGQGRGPRGPSGPGGR
jgi:predicted Fe-Mo cluster-binding NifX family protein